jgi:ribosomal protein L28
MKPLALRLLIIFVVTLAQTLLFASFTFAEPNEWQSATVVKADFGGTETEAVAVPLPGGGAVGESTTSSGKHRRGVYWLKTDKYTYVIPNYCKANLMGMQWWLYLTVGGQTKISVDSARTLRVIDDEGKNRKVHVIERIANEAQKAPQ